MFCVHRDKDDLVKKDLHSEAVCSVYTEIKRAWLRRVYTVRWCVLCTQR